MFRPLIWEVPLSVSNHFHFCCFSFMFLYHFSLPSSSLLSLSLVPNPPKHTGLGGVWSCRTIDFHLSRNHSPHLCGPAFITDSVRHRRDSETRTPGPLAARLPGRARGLGTSAGLWAQRVSLLFLRLFLSWRRGSLPAAASQAAPGAAARIGGRRYRKCARVPWRKGPPWSAIYYGGSDGPCVPPGDPAELPCGARRNRFPRGDPGRRLHVTA